MDISKSYGPPRALHHAATTPHAHTAAGNIRERIQERPIHIASPCAQLSPDRQTGEKRRDAAE